MFDKNRWAQLHDPVFVKRWSEQSWNPKHHQSCSCLPWMLVFYLHESTLWKIHNSFARLLQHIQRQQQIICMTSKTQTANWWRQKRLIMTVGLLRPQWVQNDSLFCVMYIKKAPTIPSFYYSMGWFYLINHKLKYYIEQGVYNTGMRLLLWRI